MPSAPIQIFGGQFQDSEGNPLIDGYLLFELSEDGIVNTSTRVCSGYTIRVPLNSLGSVPVSPVYALWDNTTLGTPNSFYLVSAYAASGQLVWGPNAQTIPFILGPASFDIGTWIPGDIT